MAVWVGVCLLCLVICLMLFPCRRVYTLLSQPEFLQVCHTKKDYEECGPSICRHNPVFGVMS